MAGRPKGSKNKGKVGRPRKKPGEPVVHRMTPKMRGAITTLVEQGLTIEQAAKAAGVHPSAIRKAMRHPPAREHYVSELRMLLQCAKAAAAHTLIKELTGDNAAARVAAARTLLADDDRKTAAQGMPQMPGFTFMLVDARGSQTGQAIPNGNAAPMIEVAARPVDADEAEASDD